MSDVLEAMFFYWIKLIHMRLSIAVDRYVVKAAVHGGTLLYKGSVLISFPFSGAEISFYVFSK